jgi:FixJ family two-component response regulator
MAEALLSIAIVDDDLPVLKALSRLLRGRGYDPRTYSSADEFLAGLPEEAPDSLIVDLHMPGMTGLELHQTLIRRGIQVPTIIITAHGGSEVADRCLACGAAAFLTKPIQSASLFSAIEDAMKTAGCRDKP